MSKKGHIGTLYGVPIAVEHHPDGSMTLCKELVEYLSTSSEVSEHIRQIFDLQSTTIEMLSDEYKEFKHDKTVI